MIRTKFLHCNLNVFDLQRSLEFYGKALGLSEVRRKDTDKFTLVFLGDGSTDFNLELTMLKDRAEPYDLGDNESHIAFEPEDFDAAHKHHEKMGCICFENHDMGIYFIEDPDGYWLEVIPRRS
ncbi:lactoylglutathione lyase [Synergistales bacterium]|nr:lactoylglutathione lyase [Synergistales bacterium]